MTALIVFDLDGTLADGSHREHHIIRPEGDLRPKDWDSYFAACGQDTFFPAMLRVFDTLSLHFEVEVWTGRISKYEALTRAWLESNYEFYPNMRLLMRDTADRTQDDDLKRGWLHEARARGDEVIMAFEDRARVVKMWREEGVQCFQTREGDF